MRCDDDGRGRAANIKACDAELDKTALKEYPETKLLQQVSGVGTLISLAFVLTIDDPHRFAKSRDVGCFIGLRPKRSQSGASNPQLGISKEGDRYLRSLLVQGAQYILGWREFYEPLRNNRPKQVAA